jgi:tRNA wybutosine-synthesizing protein 2
MERIRERLEAVLGAKTALLPDKWEIAGDVITVKMDPALFEFGELIGRTYAEVLSARSALADVSGVSGEFREPDMTLLYGPSGESVKLENGIRYCFDVTKVMFASGNLAERKRMKCLDCAGETVVDMFCGIGYFTLPLAKYSGARRVFACEKNPQSYGFLLKNLALNGIDNVIPLLGDNRDIPGRAFADRILMGYVQTTSVFVPKALEMAKPGCIIHYHDTFPVGKEEKMVREIFDRYCGDYTIERIIEVKSFAPGVSHYVADIRV